MNIYQKMLAITEEISNVSKNLTVGVGKNAYKAVGEADVLAAVKPVEQKNGIYSFPFEREIIATDIFIKKTEYEGNTKETQSIFVRIKTIYRFVNTDNPEEFIDITTYGDGVDFQDKAVGKAMTYADKYALLKAYKIQTGDDPDQNPSAEGKFKSKKTADTPEEVAEKLAEEKYKMSPIRLRDVADLRRLIKKTGGNEVKVCEAYKIDRLEDMLNWMLGDAKKVFQERLKAKEDVSKEVGSQESLLS